MPLNPLSARSFLDIIVTGVYSYFNVFTSPPPFAKVLTRCGEKPQHSRQLLWPPCRWLLPQLHNIIMNTMQVINDINSTSTYRKSRPTIQGKSL